MAKNGDSTLIPKNLIQKLVSKSTSQPAALFVSKIHVVRDSDDLPQHRINLRHNCKRLGNSYQDCTILTHLRMT